MASARLRRELQLQRASAYNGRKAKSFTGTASISGDLPSINEIQRLLARPKG